MPWTTIPDSLIDANSSLTETLMTYLRDNHEFFKALFNDTTGHNHDGTTDYGAPISVPDGSITQAKLKNYASGTITIASDLAEVTSNITSYGNLKSMRATRNGILSVVFDMSASGPNGYAKIFRSGASVGTERVNGGGYVTYTEDISVVIGDTIEIAAYQNSGGTVSIKNFKLKNLTWVEGMFNMTQ